MKPKFRNWFNHEEFPADHEVIDQPSLTVPDQSLSVTEILHRFANGQNLGGVPWDGFDEDTDVPDDFVDHSKIVEPAERARLQKEYQEELLSLQSKIKKDEEERRRRAQYTSSLQKAKETKQRFSGNEGRKKDNISREGDDTASTRPSSESEHE